jgi:hypothetical protein
MKGTTMLLTQHAPDDLRVTVHRRTDYENLGPDTFITWGAIVNATIAVLALPDHFNDNRVEVDLVVGPRRIDTDSPVARTDVRRVQLLLGQDNDEKPANGRTLGIAVVDPVPFVAGNPLTQALATRLALEIGSAGDGNVWKVLRRAGLVRGSGPPTLADLEAWIEKAAERLRATADVALWRPDPEDPGTGINWPMWPFG